MVRTIACHDQRYYQPFATFLSAERGDGFKWQGRTAFATCNMQRYPIATRKVNRSGVGVQRRGSRFNISNPIIVLSFLIFAHSCDDLARRLAARR